MTESIGMNNEKSVKIIISVLAIVLICAISFDVLLVNNSKQETPVNTTQNIENQVTESEEKHIQTLWKHRQGKWLKI